MDLAALRRPKRTRFAALPLPEPEREPRRPDLTHVDLSHQVRQRADVVLVSVREDDRPDRAAALPEVLEVRQDQVDAEVLVTREGEPRVDDHDRPLAFVRGHVLADLTEASERDDP